MMDRIANRYVIESLIGQGGMADVYKAHDEILNRTVAIKVLRARLAEDPLVLVRFTREASAASKLSHPNLVDIYDVGESGGLHYIVMEYVRGQTLKQMMTRRGAMDVYEARSIMLQLLDGVGAAHDAQIIHRDIKPQNVMVKADGTVKIMDFGIAVANGSVALTHNNAVMGSAHYLAPESARGQAPDVRVDIYSLGIVFYELLTNQVPFTGTTPAEIAFKHMQDPMPSVRKFNPTIPQSIENIIIRATAKDPNERYSSVREMQDDLIHALEPAHANDKKIILKTTSLSPAPGDSSSNANRNRRQASISSQSTKSQRSSKTAVFAVLASIFVVAALAGALFLTGTIRIPGFLGYETYPDIVGLTLPQAQQALEEAGFSLDDLVVQEEISDSVNTGRVISSSEKAGAIIKNDTDLTITISKGSSFLITDYTGEYLEDVEAELEEQGVSLDIQVEYQGAADTNPGIILEQQLLSPGDRIDPDANESIKFIVSSYPTITISSDLIGMDIDSAKAWLNEQGIAVVCKNVYGTGTVVSVYPAVGSTYTQSGSESVVTLYY